MKPFEIIALFIFIVNAVFFIVSAVVDNIQIMLVNGFAMVLIAIAVKK